jgi:hypothetical protein
MRKMVLLIIMMVILAAFAGCLGGEAEKKKPKEPTLVQKQATNPPQSGWIDHDGNQHASASIGVNLNDTNIVSVKFTIKVGRNRSSTISGFWLDCPDRCRTGWGKTRILLWIHCIRGSGCLLHYQCRLLLHDG